MWVPFESLPQESRIWVYQAGRSLVADELQTIANELRSFCDQWQAHGQALRSSFKLDHSLFLILAVDEGLAGASGCSIDGSVMVLRNLQERLGVDFLGRNKAAFLDGEVVKTIALGDMKEALASRILTPASIAFNTLIATKRHFDERWLVRLDETWLAKFLDKKQVV